MTFLQMLIEKICSQFRIFFAGASISFLTCILLPRSMEQVVSKKLAEEANAGFVNTIIIGASAAGLACAATLSRKGIPYLILEKNDQLAGPWRAHYDRLHLNTEKWSSHLPYLPFPKTADVYLSRDEVVQYMEEYASHFNIKPTFNQEVKSIKQMGSQWHVSTNKAQWIANHVIVATGKNRRPVMPVWRGMDAYKGAIIHSAAYKNGAAYTGKNVLVVGFGSSACEIAICLHEYGAYPSMSVKGGVNVVPRDAGNPAISKLLHRLAFLSKWFPALVDKLNRSALEKRYGFLKEYGISKLPYGPNVQMIKHKKVPVLDIGTMELIRQGVIKVFPGIERFHEEGVRFTNGLEKKFEAVILATGFEPYVKDFLTDAAAVTDDYGRPLKSGAESALRGLFFCGFTVSPYGMLNQIGKEARNIAKKIAADSRK